MKRTREGTWVQRPYSGFGVSTHWDKNIRYNLKARGFATIQEYFDEFIYRLEVHAIREADVEWNRCCANDIELDYNAILKRERDVHFGNYRSTLEEIDNVRKDCEEHIKKRQLFAKPYIPLLPDLVNIVLQYLADDDDRYDEELEEEELRKTVFDPFDE